MGHQKQMPELPPVMLSVSYMKGAGATASVNPDPAIAFIALACAFDSTCRQLGVTAQQLADQMVMSFNKIEDLGGPILKRSN